MKQSIFNNKGLSLAKEIIGVNDFNGYILHHRQNHECYQSYISHRQSQSILDENKFQKRSPRHHT